MCYREVSSPNEPPVHPCRKLPGTQGKHAGKHSPGVEFVQPTFLNGGWHTLQAERQSPRLEFEHPTFWYGERQTVHVLSAYCGSHTPTLVFVHPTLI